MKSSSPTRRQRARSSSTTSSRSSSSFLRQLLKLVDGESEEDVRDILFWSKCGHYLVIPDEEQFYDRVCCRVWGQKSISNFNKQMNNWRWRRVPRKDVEIICARDSTIWNTSARLWEHYTLTADSNEEEVSAVTRQPDGMAKKRRLNGDYSPRPPGRVVRRMAKPVRHRRTDNLSDSDSDLDSEDHCKTNSEMDSVQDTRPSTPPAQLYPILALQSASTSAAPDIRAWATVPLQPHAPSRVPYVYYPPIGDTLNSGAESAARTRQQWHRPTPRRNFIDPPAPASSIYTPQRTSSTQFSHQYIPHLISDHGSSSSGSPVPTLLTPPIDLEHGDPWSTLFRSGTESFWHSQSPDLSFLFAPLPVTEPAWQTNKLETTLAPPPPTHPTFSLSVAPSTPKAHTTTPLFAPSATLLPCLHSSPLTHVDRSVNRMVISPSIAQRRQRTEGKILASLGSAILIDQNTPTRATFGSSADLLDEATPALATTRRGLRSEGSVLVEGSRSWSSLLCDERL